MDQVPQNNWVNPSWQSNYKYNVGLPILSSFYANFENTAFNYNDAFKKNMETDTSYYLDVNGLLENTHNKNLITFDSHVNLFSLALKRKKKNYFSFAVSEKMKFILSVPGDLALAMFHGNSEFVGKYADFDKFGIWYNHYREFSFGYSTIKNRKLTYGFKAKVLFGKFSVQTQNHGMGVFTSTEDYSLNIASDVIINSSLPIMIKTDSLNNYSSYEMDPSVSKTKMLLNNKNKGFALDIGFTFKKNDKLTFAFSLLDVGFIAWKSNLNNLNQHGEFKLSGADNDSKESFNEKIVNVIYNDFGFQSSQKKFITVLPSQLYLGGYYKISKKTSAGLLLQNTFNPGKWTSSATFSVNKNISENFCTTFTYSIINSSFTNIGTGLSYQKRQILLYAISDNILGFVFPMDANVFNIRMGLNLILGPHDNDDISDTGFYWLRKSVNSRKRYDKLKKKHS